MKLGEYEKIAILRSLENYAPKVYAKVISQFGSLAVSSFITGYERTLALLSDHLDIDLVSTMNVLDEIQKVNEISAESDGNKYMKLGRIYFITTIALFTKYVIFGSEYDFPKGDDLYVAIPEDPLDKVFWLEHGYDVEKDRIDL